MTDILTNVATRTVGHRTLPVAGTYDLDQAHSSVEFVVRHLMIHKVRGTFDRFSGVIEVGEDPADSGVEVEIDATSINTRNATRDAHLRSGDFFDSDAYPTIAFRSTRVSPKGGDWLVTGDLTILGITHPVDLTVSFGAAAVDPWGNTRFGVSATGEIDRERWGLNWNEALEAGGVVLSRTVALEIEASAVRRADQADEAA